MYTTMCLMQVSAPILPFAQVSNYTLISNLFVEINHLGSCLRDRFLQPGVTKVSGFPKYSTNTQSLALAAVCRDMSSK